MSGVQRVHENRGVGPQAGAAADGVGSEDRRVKISPSLMCADLLAMGKDIDELIALGVDYLHLDVMDGHYVPNLTLGTDLPRQLSTSYATPLDIHLMVDDPDRWAPIFLEAALSGRADSAAAAGAEASNRIAGDGGSGAAASGRPVITIHPETTWHPARTLAGIAEAGGVPGIAIDPGQKPEQFENLLHLVGLVLVMTVNPGYAGQKLVPWTLESISWLRDARSRLGLSFEIEVDGNVSWDNVPRMIDSGADVLVAGTSSLFDRSLSRPEAHEKLCAML